METLKTFLKKIKKEIYIRTIIFCNWRANKAFDRGEVALYVYWIESMFKYGEKYIGLKRY